MAAAAPALITPAPTAPSWFAIRTRPNFVPRLAAGITAIGIETYVAEYTETRQWSDRKRELPVNLFPGYLFARFEPTAHVRVAIVRSVPSTNGGEPQILGSGQPEPVPDVEIDGVRRLVASGLPCASHPLLTVGQRVRVTHGALMDVEGLLVEIDGAQRLAVSIPMLGRSVAVRGLDSRHVAPVVARAVGVGAPLAGAVFGGYGVGV